MLPHDRMIMYHLVSFHILKEKHLLGMNLKLNQYSILLSMFFIMYGSTFIQQLCWVVCISFCKKQKLLHFVSYHFVIHITVKTYNYGTPG